jgi:4-hydroxythreonine-4-phosphate dehydrogenase
MTEQKKIILGVSIGDLNGIGSEVVLKTFQDSRMLELCTPVLYASSKTINQLIRHYGLDIRIHGIDSTEKIVQNRINVYNLWNEQVPIQLGKEDPKIGSFAVRSLKQATTHLKEKKIDVLVTAPINKATIQSEEFSFPGHTDYLNKELKGEALMLMIFNGLRVGLLTDHVAVKDVVTSINEELIIKKINTMNQSLIQDFGIRRPKIAVLGINPHTGDNGVIGNEDDTVLKPALDTLKDKNVLVYGPYAADSFFGSDNYKNFDAIMASYHDQGLIPFKTLSFGEGVNFTAGLDRIRTSPDHGTAFDVAGKNIADHSSFREAVYQAMNIFRKRNEYIELSRNVFKAKKYTEQNNKKKLQTDRPQNNAK